MAEFQDIQPERRSPDSGSDGFGLREEVVLPPPGAGLKRRLEFTVREVTVADLRAVQAIEREVFGAHAYSYDSLRQFYDLLVDANSSPEERRSHGFKGAFVGDELVGYALGIPHSIHAYGWFLSVAVLPDRRREGVCRQLATEVLSWFFDSLALREVRITTSPSNQAMQQIIDSAGFEFVRKEPEYFGPGEDRNIYRLTRSAYSDLKARLAFGGGAVDSNLGTSVPPDISH